jgi:hypothetical protein
MSLILRRVAAVPVPFVFGRNLGLNNRQRERLGSSINDHVSFRETLKGKWLGQSPKAQHYAERKKSIPKDLFHVDFGTVRRTVRDLPLCPVEIAVRDGNNKVIVDCLINEVGVTNAEYEAHLERMGYSHETVRLVRRLRGAPHDKPPQNAKTPKEVVQILIDKGLNPTSLWVEYSTCDFDRRCMEVLIRAAGMPVEAILPTQQNSWTVAKDFACALPGKEKTSITKQDTPY